MASDDAAHTADGRLFRAREAATENDWWPRVDRLTYIDNQCRFLLADAFHVTESTVSKHRKELERQTPRKINSLINS